MTTVIDTSAAIEIALSGKKSDYFKDAIKKSAIVAVPDLFVSEVTNVFWKYKNFSHLDEEQCLEGIEFCLSLVDDFVKTKDLWHEVLKESIKLEHPSYDIFYLVLTRRTGGILLSCDKKLIKLAQRIGIDTL